MAQLIPCPSCDRHLRTTSVVCPFCAAVLPDDLAARARSLPRARLSRAATFALGAALVAAGDGCYASHELASGGAVDAGGAAVDAGAIGTHYGGAPRDAGADLGSFPILYGAAPLDLGAPDEGADEGADAGAVGTLYGDPPAR